MITLNGDGIFLREVPPTTLDRILTRLHEGRPIGPDSTRRSYHFVPQITAATEEQVEEAAFVVVPSLKVDDESKMAECSNMITKKVEKVDTTFCTMQDRRPRSERQDSYLPTSLRLKWLLWHHPRSTISGQKDLHSLE